MFMQLQVVLRMFDWAKHDCRSTVLLAAVVVATTCMLLARWLQMLKSGKVTLAEWSCILAAHANVSPGAALLDLNPSAMLHNLPNTAERIVQQHQHDDYLIADVHHRHELQPLLLLLQHAFHLHAASI